MKRFWLVLLIILAVGAAGFGSWKYLENRNNNDSQQQTNQTVNDPSEGGKYLVIKEWGVRFKVPDELRGDLDYIDRHNAEIETFAIVSSSADLEDCAPIAITRSPEAGFGKLKIGDYHFDFLKAPQACDLKESSRQKKAAEIQEKVSAAISTLEKIP